MQGRVRCRTATLYHSRTRRGTQECVRHGGSVYFLNLSFLQFLAVFGSISAISVALYLLDRSRRKLVVSTLRFWIAAEQPAVAARRRRVQQPWSLLLQLVSMALLLLAIANCGWARPAQAGRDHVIVLDTSAWMAGRSGNRTLMDVARDRARQYLKALPVRDRVMLVRADGMATPATAFELDRKKIEDAIKASAARLHGAQPRPGAAVRAPHSGAGRPSRRRNRVHRLGPDRAARSRRRGAAAQSARDRDSRQCRKRGAAQGGHAAQRRGCGALGDLRGRRAITASGRTP